MFAYLFLFIATSFFSFLRNNKNSLIVSGILIIVLAIFSGTRNARIDNDYLEYARLFNVSVIEGYQKNYELIFYILPKFWSSILGETYIQITFLTFAFLSIWLKVVAIDKFSSNYYLSIIIYYCVFYFGYEFTTMRGGVAAGIFLFMILDIKEGNAKGYFFKLLIAFIFHYSSLLFIPIWFIIKSKMSIKYYYLALIISFVIVLIKFDIISILNLDTLVPKMKVYTNSQEVEVALNPFNFKMLIAFLYLIIFAFFYSRQKKDILFVILFKLHIISLFVFYLLAQSNMVFSLRSFDLLSVVQILLLPYLVKFLPPKTKLLGVFLIVITAIVNLYYVLFLSNNIREYSSWLF